MVCNGGGGVGSWKTSTYNLHSLFSFVKYVSSTKKIFFFNYNTTILRVQNLYSSGQFFLIVKKTPLGSKGLRLLVSMVLNEDEQILMLSFIIQ
jgi:hypothetical protein